MEIVTIYWYPTVIIFVVAVWVNRKIMAAVTGSISSHTKMILIWLESAPYRYYHMCQSYPKIWFLWLEIDPLKRNVQGGV